MLSGKFIAVNTYIKKKEKPLINNPTLQLKELEKEEKTKPKASKRKEIKKIRADINSHRKNK